MWSCITPVAPKQTVSLTVFPSPSELRDHQQTEKENKTRTRYLTPLAFWDKRLISLYDSTSTSNRQLSTIHLHFGVCIKASVYHLCHDNHLVIDRHVSTAYCRSLSGDSVDRYCWVGLLRLCALLVYYLHLQEPWRGHRQHSYLTGWSFLGPGSGVLA